MANCKSCNASIEWVSTPTGKKMPIDGDPAPDGNVVLRGGKAVVLGPEMLAELPANVPRFKSHFATCPNAAQHRKEPARG